MSRRRAVESDELRDNDGVRPVLVLQKASALLDVFTGERYELTFPEIRQATGLPASTCARLLRTLVHEGLLERDGDRYRIGVTVLRWSAAALRSLDIVTLLTPVIENLRDETGESGALYVRHGTTRTCVAVAATRHEVIWQLRVGLTTPLYVGSGGRAILAFDEPAKLATLASDRIAFTPQTITDADDLEKTLAEIRATGVAVSHEELSLGVAGVSAPVFGVEGKIVGSLGVSGPSQRFGPDDVDRYSPAVLESADTASHRMGNESWLR